MHLFTVLLPAQSCALHVSTCAADTCCVCCPAALSLLLVFRTNSSYQR